MKKQRIRLPRRDGLVAEYLLNGNANDTSGNGNNGTPTNVTYSKTDRGYQTYAGNFNDASSIISTSGSVAIGNAFTFLVWYKFDGRGGSNTIVSVNERVSIPNDEVNLYVSGNTINVEYANSAGSGTYPNVAVVHDNTWKFAAVTFANNTVSMWIDGQPVTVTNPTITSKSITRPCTIGAATFGVTTYYYGGNIQSVRIFNRVLSADEIRDWYLEGLRALGGSSLSGLMDGLVAYYDFRGDANDIISGYDGTVNGATLTTDRFGTANNAYDFNGSSYINIPNNSVCNALNNFTRHIVCTIPNTTSYGKVYSNAYAHLLVNNTLIQVYHYTGADYVLNYFHSIPAGTTVYCTWVKSSTEGIKLYVNGELVASNPSGTGDTYPRGNLGIGGDNWYGEYHTGRIDSVELYNRIFSASEVKALYELSKQSKLLPFA